eukprot:3422935-Amphidinium_carterae.1
MRRQRVSAEPFDRYIAATVLDIDVRDTIRGEDLMADIVANGKMHGMRGTRSRLPDVEEEEFEEDLDYSTFLERLQANMHGRL